MKNNAVIFDLDGTLVDSIEDIAISVNIILEKNNLETHELEAYKQFIGNGAKVLIQKATLNKFDDEKVEDLLAQFVEVYKEQIDTRTKVFDGIYELLDNLEKINYKKAILSNKPHAFTTKCVQSFFDNYNFINISGQKKELPKKPDPIAALNIAKELETDASDIFFVGDTKVDMQTAKNSGMTAIGVLWGFRDERELKDNGADFIVSNTDELYEILTKYHYTPIPCAFYDELESAAVRKTINSIIYIDENDKENSIEDIVVDFKTLNKEEFMILKSEKQIRLDKIVEFNSKKIEDYLNCSV